MWSADELINIDTSVIQKYVPYPTNAQTIEDFVGNLLLYPNILPTTQKEQHLFLAVSAGYYKTQNHIIKESEFQVPPKIHLYAANTLEASLLTIISTKIPKISLVTGKDNITVSIISIVDASGSILIDSGLTTKQRIDFDKPDLTAIPIRRPTHCIIRYKSGIPELPEYRPIEIPISTNILLVSTLTPDNFTTLPPATSKKKLNEWLKLSILKS